MSDIDYNDIVVEETWCNSRREEVIEYLQAQQVIHGAVGEWPAWHVAPYVSIWAIESKINPGWIGWWVISGDLPTDYISADSIKHPREALLAFSNRWREMASYMERGELYPAIKIGPPESWPMLIPLLNSRAKTLYEWANDEEMWYETDI